MDCRRVLVASLLAIQALGRLVFSPSELTQTEYDFVIVGVGTAGSVLASRLSEDPSVSVLAIEAGGSNEDVLATIAPFLAVSLPGTSVDWNYTTPPIEGYNNRTLGYTRGYGLGGSSVLNLLTWNRGSIDLWNRWASLTGDSGWSWDAMEPYWLKVDNFVSQNATGKYDPLAHGYSGEVNTSLPGWPTELDPLVCKASAELGGRFAWTQDHNSGTFLGTSYMQSAIGGGERSSAATAYLYPVIERANLDVLVNTRVAKLVEGSSKSGTLSFTSAVLSQGPEDEGVTINAAKEVILSAGVFGTPQILQLSGIGAKSSIENLGISTIVDLPDVGEFLKDHPAVAAYYLVNSNNTFDSLLRNSTLFADTLAEWQATRSGRFVDSPANTYTFLRWPEESDIYAIHGDPSSGETSGHMEVIFVDGFAQFGPLAQPAEGSFLTLLAGVVSPTTNGSVTLNTTNIFDQPTIAPDFIASEFDQATMVQVLKDVETFMNASAWKDFIIGPYGDFANATTDALKLQFVRKYGSNINHPVGTARMSPREASWGVLDAELLVKGTSGLRVVDASVFPTIPESHTQAPVYMVAERAVDLIKAKHLLS
ncbi:GMC oxidoreductase [Cylindrobasidium torrendii FP15055 ss-10]|uniref:GMC oxidoreductase n=1 Tax=Cylindrobasidium torrendii FP15055 ss-10 TaxID=1314674 RepID=A0A0D7B8P0_9AGAR|nr:GMC oxidoreductase [Cylindrobasidium torrendii FP15055 ss-10]